MKRRYWWARCDGIKYTGPFTHNVLAWEAIMTTDNVPAPGACVWYGTPPVGSFTETVNDSRWLERKEE